MNPSTNIPTPRAWMKEAAAEIYGTMMMALGFAAAFSAEELPQPPDETTIKDFAAIIARHAPSPSPVPTDDDALRKALEAIRSILAEPDGCRFCDFGKLRSPEKSHDEWCGFALAQAFVSDRADEMSYADLRASGGIFADEKPASPVPTDDGLEMAAREAETIPTIRQLVHDLEREVNEVHGGDASVDQFVPILCRLFAERIRALKGNSLPAPAIETEAFPTNQKRGARFTKRDGSVWEFIWDATEGNAWAQVSPATSSTPAPAIEDGVERATIDFPSDLHPATKNLVARFAVALANKLHRAEIKYGYSDGWASPDWQEECTAHLAQHVSKGDPLDVAAYAAFCFHHSWSTALQSTTPPAASGRNK